MRDLALLFPGQGSQFVGMGREWIAQYPAAGHVFEEASDLLGLDVAKLALDGPEESLSTTFHSQLVILTTGVAIWRALSSLLHVQTAICAGLSLGEFTALVVAEKLTFSRALLYVKRRAKLMETCCLRVHSGMTAIVGIDREVISTTLKRAPFLDRVWIANENAKGQIAIAGYREDLNRAKSALESLGARGIDLAVEGAFHTPLMKSAERALLVDLGNLEIANGRFRFFCGVSAQLCETPEQIKRELAHQMSRPVLWRQTARAMELENPRCSIEIGGRTLAALHRRNGCKSPIASLVVPDDLGRLTDLLKWDQNLSQRGGK